MKSQGIDEHGDVESFLTLKQKTALTTQNKFPFTSMAPFVFMVSPDVLFISKLLKSLVPVKSPVTPPIVCAEEPAKEYKIVNVKTETHKVIKGKMPEPQREIIFDYKIGNNLILLTEAVCFQIYIDV